MADMHFTLKEFPKASVSLRSDYSRAVEYTDGEVKIKSITLNGEALTPDEKKNVDIDIDVEKVVNQSYLSGSGAPTETTKADFVGQMYSDTENNKLYQCTGITEAEDGANTYAWIKVIRNNDRANENFKAGIVEVDDTYGISYTAAIMNGVRHEGILRTYSASHSDIDKKTHHYRPIVPSNLDYAVMSVCRNVIGKFTVTPMVSGVTAKFMFDLIYPFDFDGYKIFVNDTETSDGIIKKGSGFVTAPAIFDGDNVKVYFYSGKTAVFYAGVKKLSEIAHAKNGSIKYGVLCT